MKKNIILNLFVLLIGFSCFSQTIQNARKITKDYDLEKIKNKEFFYSNQSVKQRQKALTLAKQKHWQTKVLLKNGSIEELMGLTPDGFPIYYSNNNVDAAKSTRVNHLQTGGSLGLNLNGEGMIARVWDGGVVRRTHTFFDNNRVTTIDDTSSNYSAHPTHVTGTILSSATNSARGMAPKATARTFNWDNDDGEALAEAQLGMLLSNHSYGTPITSTSGGPMPAKYIGAYTQESRKWDDIAYLAPYYLAVVAAGNDGNNNDNTNPIAYGFDKLIGNKNSKNNLVVANAQDAVVDANGTLISNVLINYSSSQGPTDDRRIKPDITGNGTGLLSSTSISDIATTIMTGTSMAAPNVTGSLLLIQQHYKNVIGNYMRAATLKALACHTADDAGNQGPDAIFGWGLLNAKTMVETINNNGLQSWISENTLKNNQIYEIKINSDGTQPLKASIVWTDLPGVANTGTQPTNDATPVLINDLDIRILQDNNTTYYPWKLANDPALPATQNIDNNLDTVEQVTIPNPAAGTYTIRVSHKNNLITPQQNYSLVITGINTPIGLVSTAQDQIVCGNQTAIFTYNHTQTNTQTTTFTVVGLPAQATATLSKNTSNTNDTITLTITGLSNIPPDTYTVGIQATNGTNTQIRTNQLTVYNSIFNPINAVYPTDLSQTIPANIIIKWQSITNTQKYTIQISENTNFSTLVTNTDTTNNEFLATNLSAQTTYYWRIFPSNQCSTANTVNTFSFTTGGLNCANTFVATDFSNATISATQESIATVPIAVTGGIKIGDIKVNLDITHPYIQDLTVYLEGPQAIGSPRVYLLREPCGEFSDILCQVTDAGNNIFCQGQPAITNQIKPYEPLAKLNNLIADGQWVLTVKDPYLTDGGQINAFSLQICDLSSNTLNTIKPEFKDLSIYPNPNTGVLHLNFNTDINPETTITVYDLQGRSIIYTKATQNTQTLYLQDLQNGFYFVTIENNDQKTTKKIILNK